MSTGVLYLRFLPDATLDQLKQFQGALAILDDDAPVDRIGIHGITGERGMSTDQYVSTSTGEERGAYWRKPSFGVTDEVLVGLLEAAGLHGHGWFLHDFDEHSNLGDARRFTFGTCPKMAKRIATAKERQAREGAVFAATQALINMAKRGEDAMLVGLAAQLREAQRLLDDAP